MEGAVVIGISGYVGSGKTSLADYFIQGHGFRRLSFADKIREIMVVLGVDMETLRDPVRKEEPHPALCGATPRQFMEDIGKLGRDLTKDQLWVRQFQIAGMSKPLIVCDDVRHQNEVDTIMSMGGGTYRLNVPGTEPRVRTDFAVQKLERVEDITNVHGETRLKDIYRYVYRRAFGPGITEASFEAWVAAGRPGE